MSKGILYLIGAILYVLFPRDLIPDFLAGWGWIDDAAILYMLWRYYRRMKQQRSANGAEQTGQTDGGRQSRNADPGGRRGRDPYTVLEIGPDASREEIRAAYRRLAAQYHPDKVQHLGKEIRELAEARFKEIQEAYDQLKQRGS